MAINKLKEISKLDKKPYGWATMSFNRKITTIETKKYNCTCGNHLFSYNSQGTLWCSACKTWMEEKKLNKSDSAK